MKRPKVKNRLLVIVLVLLIVGVPTVLFVKSSIKNKIKKEIAHFNDTHPISLTYDDLSFSVLNGNATVHNLKVQNDTIELNEAHDRPHIDIGKLRLRGVNLVSAVFSKKVKVNKVLIEDLNLKYLEKTTKKTSSSKSIDSIRIQGLNNLDIGTFEIDRYQLTKVNRDNDTLNFWTGNSFTLEGFKLEKQTEINDYFKFNIDDLMLSMVDQSVVLNEANYDISVGSLKMHFGTGNATISQLKLLPINGAQAFSESRTYNDDVISLEIEQLQTFGLQSRAILLSQNIKMDSVAIDQARVDILKNKHRPTNESKRPLFIHQKLRNSNNDINISSISLKNSSIYYVELNPGRGNTEVDITNASVKFTNMNNTHTENDVEPMVINIVGTVLQKVPVEVTLTFPDIVNSDTFYFKGSTGAAQFESFNTVMLPTTGIKFEKGNLNSIAYNGVANASHSEGELTMLFDDLQTTVLKKDKESKNKAFSFMANTAVKKRNPSKNGKVSVATIEFERVPYKGLGNFLFKSIESGLINSVYPFGSRKKSSKKDRKNRK